MKIKQLEIRRFRGIENMTLTFDDHTVVIGPNGAGKTTIIDALSLVLGRDRMIRDLTEHDFFGCNPQPTDRVDIVVTLSGFDGNDASRNPLWFRDGRGIPKWWNKDSLSAQATPRNDVDELCLQIAYAGRFDCDTLTVESRRYFYDDRTLGDAFDEEGITDVPFRLLKDVGFFLVPSQRTWERLASFESELFRRVVRTFGGLPAEQLLTERDRLRSPSEPLEKQKGLAEIISRINGELRHLMPSRPEFQLRVTSTDSESLLRSITPHYMESNGYALPAGRHGTGLLSLQTLVLLLEFGRARRDNGDSFILAVEEPELHFPPAIQRRAIYRTQTIGTQTICTSHSPHVAAFYGPTQIRVLDGLSGKSVPRPLLAEPLDAESPNAIRKLLVDNRHDVVDSLMHSRVLIPEGRIECEFLRLLCSATEQSEGWNLVEDSETPAFGTAVGVIPTHDGSVCKTFECLRKARSGIAVLVDADATGDSYVEDLLQLCPPPEIILQWPNEWMIEDVIVWVLEADGELLDTVKAISPVEFDTLDELRELLKLKSSGGGLKTNYLAYRDIIGEIRGNEAALIRTKQVLDDLRCGCFGESNARLINDPRTTKDTKVIRWSPS